MRIRRAKLEDSAAIARLRRQTIRAVNSKDYAKDAIGPWVARTGAKSFRESSSTCKRWVALDKDKIIGFVEHNFECELNRLYVHKDYMGEGVGSRLFQVAEESLMKQGCKKIMISSTITAKDFYKKKGYTVLKKVNYKGNKKEPIYKMEKKIS